MRANVLADSSFFIDRLRDGEDPFEEFAARASGYEFLTCGVVVTEVLRGVRIEKTHRRLSDLFACMVYIPTSNRIWERAAKMAWELDRAGCVMQITDLLIAVSAVESDAAVLTLDSDFQRVPGLRVLSTLA